MSGFDRKGARPRIAITAGESPAGRYSLHRGYVDAIWAAGGIPSVVAGAPDDADVACQLLSGFDGLLITGGGDISPSEYGSEVSANLMDVDPDRDSFELTIFREARAADLPILGICRGVQLIAVGSGGRLTQDLVSAGFANHWHEKSQGEPVHEVRTAPGSLAEHVVGSVIAVNSIHHQAVAEVGEGCWISGRSPDGVAETLEGRHILGVQWHPERMLTRDSRNLRAFSWLVEAAGRPRYYSRDTS